MIEKTLSYNQVPLLIFIDMFINHKVPDFKKYYNMLNSEDRLRFKEDITTLKESVIKNLNITDEKELEEINKIYKVGDENTI